MGKRADTSAARGSSRLSALAPWLIIAAGLALLAWPVVTDWYFAWQAEQSIQEIVSVYDDMSDPERLQNLEQARAWNARQAHQPYAEPAGDIWEYRWQLTYKSTPESMMAWLDVPKIGTRLPIFHGTGEAELMAGVGHCDWSSLPVGGEGMHCVLTAHSGMQGTRMFDDINLLQEGDVFVVWALGEPYAYRVCRIRTILPEQIDALHAEEGRDLCTLVTCTPFGVNTHRLLVTGERCEYTENMGATGGLTPWVNRRTEPLLAGMAVLAALLFVLWCRRRKRKRDEGREQS